MEKYGKNGRFSRWLRPDWGDTARAVTTGLGSKGLRRPPVVTGDIMVSCSGLSSILTWVSFCYIIMPTPFLL